MTAEWRGKLWLYQVVFSLQVCSCYKFCAIVWLVRLSKSSSECRVQSIHSGPEKDNTLSTPSPLHCLTSWCFCSDRFLSSLHHTVALHFFIRKKKEFLVVPSTFCRTSSCKCLYIVQHLYKQTYWVLFWGVKK